MNKDSETNQSNYQQKVPTTATGPIGPSVLPTGSKERKTFPIASGVLDYFPDAIAAVAQVSFIGNQQHNPGEPLHWDRTKSTDHADCICRHLLQRGTFDDDNVRHSAKLAWRALANLQIELENALVPTMLDVPLVHPEVSQSKVDELCEKIGRARYGDTVAMSALDLETIRGHTSKSLRKESGELRRAIQARLGANTIEVIDLGGPDMLRVATIDHNGTHAKMWVDYAGSDRRACYIAGPMRGYKDFNFPAFDDARNRLLRLGWIVISPADLDRENGVHEDTPESEISSEEQIRIFVERDVRSLLALRAENKDAIVLLEGWERSTGAGAELPLSLWLGLNVLDANTLNPFETAGYQDTAKRETYYRYCPRPALHDFAHAFNDRFVAAALRSKSAFVRKATSCG